MRDDLQGGILATVIAAPLMIVCCSAGGVALTAIMGAVGGWVAALAVWARYWWQRSQR